MRTNRDTGMTKILERFLDFAKVPKYYCQTNTTRTCIWSFLEQFRMFLSLLIQVQLEMRDTIDVSVNTIDASLNTIDVSVNPST
jgi:hypothetical protein